ncbi:MAG: acetylornithine deacetylase [Pseudomonadales bacterium]|jgi:acetylornithine deacetylase|nr:acetylornithine deacetylase [Pseudomonadales bacterium]MDP6469521.1 acetylornithine deacetylase [Pseudomonadales bacterium]MDP6827362.1 acetylornithine deacetylase [Pseudomonadales bacterium]MDP6971185.1 acetylornithine deacetylase [Pseudomonadales bacterium]|tara:strand:- start:1080 stop:2243 length:1164 start_codon:yes stop_codon:yes gene_type:complete
MTLPSFKEMLGTLIGTPSISCTCPDTDQSNLGVIDALATWLVDLNFSVEVTPIPSLDGHRHGKANLVATLGSGPGGVVLSGHTDTVPFDEDAWQCSPFDITDRDDRFYGLGSCDMKGFFPVALRAAKDYAEARLAAPLTIIATADEESTMAGGRFLLEKGRPRAACAIIGEPTGLIPVYAHKGMMMLSISLQGSSGHSSNPDLGRNALDAMHVVMGALISFRQELAERYRNPGFEVDIPTLNLGCLRAGDSPNRICDHAELQIDLRLLPGMDCDAILAELRRRIDVIAVAHDMPLAAEPFYPPISPFETDVNGDLVQTLSRLSGNAPGTVAFGTEGPFLQGLGMETVVFGPGSIDQAHQPNEYLEHNQIEPATRVLKQVIERYCRPA